MGKHKRQETDEVEGKAKKIKTEENATAEEEKIAKKEKKSKKEKKEKKNKKTEEQVEENVEEKAEEKKEKKKEKKDKKEKKEKKHKKDKTEEETAEKEETPSTEEKESGAVDDPELDSDFVIKKPQIQGNFNVARPGMKPQRTGNNNARGGAAGGNRSFNKQPEGPVDETSAEVYVNGYPYETTEDQVKDLFKDCGTIKNITLPRFDDNPDRCRGFGFVEFSTAEEATKALELNGTPLGKRTISVQRKLSRAGKAPRNAEVSKPLGKCPDNCSTLFCGNLSFDVTDEAMKGFFKEFDVQDIRYGEDRETGQFKGFAFVVFPSSEETEKAAKLNGQKLLGRPIRLDYSLPKNRN